MHYRFALNCRRLYAGVWHIIHRGPRDGWKRHIEEALMPPHRSVMTLAAQGQGTLVPESFTHGQVTSAWTVQAWPSSGNVAQAMRWSETIVILWKVNPLKNNPV